jgi:hypothetical protein
MFVGKIEKDTFGFATFLLKLFKTGFGLSISGYPKCILNVSYIGAPFVFSCLKCSFIEVDDASARLHPKFAFFSFLLPFLGLNIL